MAETSTLRLSELQKNAVSKRSIGGRDVLIYREGDDVYAVSGRCTHLNVALPAQAQGGVVTCPFHGAQFDLRGGHCLRGALSRDWQRATPLGFGSLAAALIPKKTSPDLERFAVQVMGDEVQITV